MTDGKQLKINFHTLAIKSEETGQTDIRAPSSNEGSNTKFRQNSLSGIGNDVSGGHIMPVSSEDLHFAKTG
jgi:hypothetical protein